MSRESTKQSRWLLDIGCGTRCCVPVLADRPQRGFRRPKLCLEICADGVEAVHELSSQGYLDADASARAYVTEVVYTVANHFPWDERLRPQLTTDWLDLGNAPDVEEYIRRQAISGQEYRHS
jgi:hypothetical protein